MTTIVNRQSEKMGVDCFSLSIDDEMVLTLKADCYIRTTARPKTYLEPVEECLEVIEAKRVPC